MATTVTFTKDATTITLPAPLPGAPTGLVRPQATGRSAAGTLYVYDSGQTRYARVETFESLTAAEKADLASFFATVGGQKETFTYTDSGGASYTARFETASLTFTKQSPASWDVEVPRGLDSLGT
jgi:hypothetical protein